MPPEIWSLKQACDALEDFLKDPASWGGPDSWLEDYAKNPEWASACNAHIPVAGAGKIPVDFLKDMRAALLSAKEAVGRNWADFDFEAAKAMRDVVEKHYGDDRAAFEASAASPDLWTLLSVYIVPDIVLWRWTADQENGWSRPYELKKNDELGSFHGAIADRYGVGARRNNLVRDTFSRIWWKMDLTEEICQKHGSAAFGPTPAKWQERPSLFSYSRVAEHVADKHGSGKKPHPSDTEWSAEYGFLFSVIHPEYADLEAADATLRRQHGMIPSHPSYETSTAPRREEESAAETHEPEDTEVSSATPVEPKAVRTPPSDYKASDISAPSVAGGHHDSDGHEPLMRVIIEILRANPGMTKKEIGRAVRETLDPTATNSDVNRVLYRENGTFTFHEDDRKRPRWSLRGRKP